MSVRFRPYDPNRRFVWAVPFTAGREQTRWWSLHAASPDWRALFSRALDLMMIPAIGEGDAIAIGSGTGRVSWRGTPRWTRIDVDLQGMSEKKQAVVKAALLKAARYAQ
jgi:hypothetical protein